MTSMGGATTVLTLFNITYLRGREVGHRVWDCRIGVSVRLEIVAAPS